MGTKHTNKPTSTDHILSIPALSFSLFVSVTQYNSSCIRVKETLYYGNKNWLDMIKKHTICTSPCHWLAIACMLAIMPPCHHSVGILSRGTASSSCFLSSWHNSIWWIFQVGERNCYLIAILYFISSSASCSMVGEVVKLLHKNQLRAHKNSLGLVLRVQFAFFIENSILLPIDSNRLGLKLALHLFVI